MMRVRAVRLFTANVVLGAVSLPFFLGTTVGVGAAAAASQPEEALRGTFRLQAVAAPVISATLVQTIATSAWNPGSPDPSGVVYLRSGSSRGHRLGGRSDDRRGLPRCQSLADHTKRNSDRYGDDARVLERANRAGP